MNLLKRFLTLIKTLVIVLLVWFALHQPIVLLILVVWAFADQRAKIQEHNLNVRNNPVVPIKPKKYVKPVYKIHWSVADKQAYLRTDAWKNLRFKVLERDKYTCQCCGIDFGPLYVHHLTYERLGNELLEDLITLCEDCHKLQHDHYGYSYEISYSPLIVRQS